MGIGLIFWILMLVWLAFTLWSNWPVQRGSEFWGHNAFLFVLLLLLGWGVFGAPVRG
jgi:hypothetical protein